MMQRKAADEELSQYREKAQGYFERLTAVTSNWGQLRVSSGGNNEPVLVADKVQVSLPTTSELAAAISQVRGLEQKIRELTTRIQALGFQ